MVQEPGAEELGPARLSVPFELADLRPEDDGAAAAMLARAMRDNPLHVRVFGADPIRREGDLTRLFTGLIVHHRSHGFVLAARHSNAIVGVCGAVATGGGTPSFWQAMRLAPLLMGRSRVDVTLRIARWASGWQHSATVDAAWHVGPIAVDPAYQRQGVGRALLTSCCDRIDAVATAATLDTDRESTISFYESLGFQTLGEASILGVPNWRLVRTIGDRRAT